MKQVIRSFLSVATVIMIVRQVMMRYVIPAITSVSASLVHFIRRKTDNVVMKTEIAKVIYVQMMYVESIGTLELKLKALKTQKNKRNQMKYQVL